MIYTGFYIIAVMLISELYKSIKLNLGIIIGIIIPDLVIFLNYFNSQTSFHGEFSHSIISIILIYIVLLIFNELLKTKNKINSKIINGIFIGMLLHVTLDIIFSVGIISFYWPLPISPIYPLYEINLFTNYWYLIACFQFFALRIFGHKILFKLIKNDNLPSKCYNNINVISKWISLQTIFILLFLFMHILNINFYVDLINFCLLCSLMISVYFLYNNKEITIKEFIIG